MDLQNIWFVIIAIFWGFFVPEGSTSEWGCCTGSSARTTPSAEWRSTHRTVLGRQRGVADRGWRGHLRCVPGWYATMFSSLYLALVLVLLALMAAWVAFEYRGKKDSQRWRSGWSLALGIGSAPDPLLLGVGLGDLLVGCPSAPIRSTPTFWNLLTPYGLLTGVGLLVLCLSHGASFLALKTTGEVHNAATGMPSSSAALPRSWCCCG